MCDCSEKELGIGPHASIRGVNTITSIFPSCRIASCVRDFDDKKRPVKPLIRWHPNQTRKFVPLLPCNDRLICKASISSSDDTSSESSKIYEFVDDIECGRKSDEGECHDDDEDHNNKMGYNKFKTVPKQLNQTSRIHKDKKPDIECTLALINPDAVKHQIFIEQIIIDEGFEICQKKIVLMTPEQTANFFKDKIHHASFPHLITYMSSGPIVALLLAKHHAINDWKKLMGPEEVVEAKLYFPDSIRAIFGKDKPFENTVHGSSSYTAAQREIRFFFPNFTSEPIMTGDRLEKFIWDTMSPTLKKGIILCCRKRPDDPVTWLANWLLENNPNKEKVSIENGSSAELAALSPAKKEGTPPRSCPWVCDTDECHCKLSKSSYLTQRFYKY